ncbi:hypothetical protein [Streptomyces sp. NBC_00847]|uniref:hypothetical protein n=1 Tax=Streptomyces sp. NBC_00847 TaxID=2975850 RepID=UPI00225DFC14|nr:hypothetical protein [Streptomyces sp. NBC_00847]MCX4885623.1 hypothetical protein [Streptomyces sp. NBC_00847]
MTETSSPLRRATTGLDAVERSAEIADGAGLTMIQLALEFVTAHTVRAYFAAINSGDFKRAWRLGGSNLTQGAYSAFVKGFEGTASDAVTVISVAGDRVEIELDATQTDGTHRYFAGTYTVRGGVIVAASIQRQ